MSSATTPCARSSAWMSRIEDDLVGGPQCPSEGPKLAEAKRRRPVPGSLGAVDHELWQHQRPDERVVIDGAGDADDDHPLDVGRVQQSDRRGVRPGNANPGDHRDHCPAADLAGVAQVDLAQRQPPSQGPELHGHGEHEGDHSDFHFAPRLSAHRRRKRNGE